MSLFDKAVAFAAEKHSGMIRKLDSSPYILHPLEVAVIVSSLTSDEEVLAAAVLHDVVEDTDTDISVIEELFGSRVAALVASETENKRHGLPRGETWLLRKEESLRVLKNAADPGVAYLWLGDKLSNMRSLSRALKKQGAEVWNRFNQRDPAMHAMYYRRIARLLSGLNGSEAWQEYHALVEKVFEGVPEV